MKKLNSFSDIQLEDIEIEISSPKTEEVVEVRKEKEVSKNNETQATEKKRVLKKNFVEGTKNDRRLFAKTPSQNNNTEKKRKIVLPNNEYANLNTSFILNRGTDSWSFKYAGQTLYTSMRFPCFKYVDSGKNSYIYYCSEKTWKNSRLVKIDGKDVLVPDLGWSTTFLNINPPGGRSASLESVEPAAEGVEVYICSEIEINKKNGSRTSGSIVCHNGPIFATFKITGKSIEDNRVINVEIGRDGKSKIIS